MPARSAIQQLPEPLLQELDKRLVRGSFSDYHGLSAWLGEQGFTISKSALHRYGSAFEDRLGALKLCTEQARAIVAESPDNEGAMAEALTRLTQEKMFGILMDLQVDPETIDITKLGRAVADLTRSSVSQKKWAAEARKAALAEAAAAVDAVARKGAGLTKDKADEIKKAILGVGA